MYPPAPSLARPKNSTGGTAEILVLVALVFQLIFTLVLTVTLFRGAAFLFFFGFGALGFALGAIVLLVGLFFLYAGFAWVYQRARAGSYDDARPWALLLGVLGIPFGFILVGLLYLIAYVMLGTAANEQRTMAAAAPSMGAPPMGASPAGPPVYAAAPAPGTAPPPMGAPAPMSAAPVCPRCGRPGTWIPQYGRYYCYTDQQYL